MNQGTRNAIKRKRERSGELLYPFPVDQDILKDRLLLFCWE